MQARVAPRPDTEFRPKRERHALAAGGPGPLQAHRPTSETGLHEYLFKAIGFPQGGRALDAGCGVCGPAAHFARHGEFEIEALTVAAHQAELARGYVETQGLSSKINVRVGD